MLTRSLYLPGLVLLTFYAAWRQQHRLKQVALAGSFAVLLMALLLAPHQYGIYKRHGDAFAVTNMLARWLANWEFAGTPGFPTREELLVDGTRGPRLTYFQYLFRLHIPGEVIMGTLRGLVKIAARMNVIGSTTLVPSLGDVRSFWLTDHIVAALGAIGIFVALGSAGFRWLPLTFLALTLHVSFVFDRGLAEPYRHTLQALPFFLVCGLLAVRQAFAWGILKLRALRH